MTLGRNFIDTFVTGTFLTSVTLVPQLGTELSSGPSSGPSDCDWAEPRQVQLRYNIYTYFSSSNLTQQESSITSSTFLLKIDYYGVGFGLFHINESTK